MRVRACSFKTFNSRYKPVMLNNSIIRDYRDPEVCAAFDAKNFNLVWTLVSGDNNDYIVPGFHSVNYMGRILCKVPWPEWEEGKPGYVY